jgi:3-oxoacyl-[acyl-carrier protein] reductase
MRELENKNAIVTGARTGICRAVVEVYAEAGCNVWAVVHREDKAFRADMAALAKRCGVWVKVVNINLEDEEDIKRGMREITSEKRPIDILVNGAGVTSPSRLILMTSLKEMHRVMQVNFFAAVQMAQLTFKVMMRQKSGSIINIASIAGIDGDLSQLEYGASKAALICATKKMAYEWGDFGIRVNAIAPGIIDTKMLGEMDTQVVEELICKTSLHRAGKPEEIAQLCVFLGSDKSSYISSETIRIDGGGYKFRFHI